MKIFHHKLEIELDDAWWAEAGMQNFASERRAYRVDKENCMGKEVIEIRIDDVSPVKRNSGVNVFNDNENKSARERVVEILEGFVSDAAIPPVEMVKEMDGSNFRYKLTNGAHRFYCSLAAGFSHVPAVKGFDINSLDQ